MIARVARFVAQPDRFRTGDYRWVLDAIKGCEGFVAAYHLVDESRGDSISISLFESADAARKAEEQVGAAREQLNVTASPPDEVHEWRVLDSSGG